MQPKKLHHRKIHLKEETPEWHHHMHSVRGKAASYLSLYAYQQQQNFLDSSVMNYTVGQNQ